MDGLGTLFDQLSGSKIFQGLLQEGFVEQGYVMEEVCVLDALLNRFFDETINFWIKCPRTSLLYSTNK